MNPPLRPFQYSATRCYPLKLKYINLELLNSADIFLAYFLGVCYVEQAPVQNTRFWCDR
jgi:hypothetical protein